MSYDLGDGKGVQEEPVPADTIEVTPNGDLLMLDKDGDPNRIFAAGVWKYVS